MIAILWGSLQVSIECDIRWKPFCSEWLEWPGGRFYCGVCLCGVSGDPNEEGQDPTNQETQRAVGPRGPMTSCDVMSVSLLSRVTVLSIFQSLRALGGDRCGDSPTLSVGAVASEVAA